MGPDDATVTIVEFSDFQCPYCQRANPVLKEIMGRYPEDVRVVYRHLPLDSIHPQARAGAEASACAEEGGKFWEYHDLLFENARALAPEDLQRYAEDVGLEAAAFEECVETRRHAAAVQADVLEAQSIGITGTPAFVVNGVVRFGLQSVEDLDALVQEELAAEEDES
jgi:protein-disulfide isomerase